MSQFGVYRPLGFRSHQLYDIDQAEWFERKRGPKLSELCFIRFHGDNFLGIHIDFAVIRASTERDGSARSSG